MQRANSSSPRYRTAVATLDRPQPVEQMRNTLHLLVVISMIWSLIAPVLGTLPGYEYLPDQATLQLPSLPAVPSRTAVRLLRLLRPTCLEKHRLCCRIGWPSLRSRRQPRPIESALHSVRHGWLTWPVPRQRSMPAIKAMVLCRRR